MDSENRNKYVEYALLMAGFISLVSVRWIKISGIYGITTFLWMALFLYLQHYISTGRQKAAVCFTFSAGYIVRYFGLTGIAAADVVMLALFGMLIYGLFSLYIRFFAKSGKLIDTLAFPFIWMFAFIILMQLRLPSVMRVDIMFFDIKALVESEAIITSYGVSFVILWSIALLVFALYNKKSKPLVLALVLPLTMSVYGVVRLNNAEEPDFTIRTAYSTGPYVGDFLNFVALPYDTMRESLISSVESAADQDASVLVFSEEAFGIEDTKEADFRELIAEEAAQHNMHILASLDIEDTDGSEDGRSLNRIVWFDNSGHELGEYDKYQTIPFLESDYTRGSGEIPECDINVDGKDVKVSFAICYDSNFPSYMSRMKDDTELLVLPSWDWDVISDLHYRLCGTLSIENGVSLIKPTYDGYTVVTDPYGRIVSLTSTDDTGYGNVSTVEIPIYG